MMSATAALQAACIDEWLFLRWFSEPVVVPHVRGIVVQGVLDLQAGNVDSVPFARCIDDDLAENGFNVPDTKLCQ